MMYRFPHLGPESLACLGFLLLSAPDSRPLSDQPAKVPVVSIEATVTNGRGEVIRGLTVKDFTIYDEGRAVDLLSCEPPISHAIALVVDKRSLQLVHDRAVWDDLKRGLSRLRPNDRVALQLLEDGNIRKAQDFTTDTKTIVQILESHKTRQRRQTTKQPVFEAVATAAQSFPQGQSGIGRAIVVLSNDQEWDPRVKADDAAAEALKAGARVHHVILDSRSGGIGVVTLPWPLPRPVIRVPDPSISRPFAGMAAVVRQTGGMQMDTASTKDSFSTILDHLGDEYLLSYVQPSANRGDFRSIVVKLSEDARSKHPDAEVRTRSGYFSAQ